MSRQGVDVNYKKAFEWYKKAAEQGHTVAQYNLGVMYHHGVGVNPSDSEAMRWFAKAAAQGHEGAQDKIDTILAKRRSSSSSSAAGASREDK